MSGFEENLEVRETKTLEETDKKCPSCGGVMEFDVATQSLKCPNCGTEEKIEANRQTVKEHKLTDYAKRTVKAGEKKSSTMQCPSCGAMVEVEATSTAKDCPYCGTPFCTGR